MIVLGAFDAAELEQRLLMLEVFRRFVAGQGAAPLPWVARETEALQRLVTDVSAARSGQERPTLGVSGGMVDGGGVTRLLLSYEEAAEQLGISPRAVRRLASTGELATVTVGRSRRVHRDDLEQYAASLRSRGPDPGPDVLRRRARFKEGA